MSLCVAVVVPEGIVVAGDSRTTQTIAGINRVASDNAVKVFDLAKGIVAATAGWAFLQPSGDNMQKNISSVVEEFKATIPEGSTVQRIATLLWEYFNNVYQQHIAQLPKSALAPGMVALNFIVAGYDSGASDGALYTVDIPSTVAPSQPARSTKGASGPWWIGQVDVLARILKGYDAAAYQFPFLKTALEDPANKALIAGLEYSIFCSTMTIQDAIDFAVEMIRVTIAVQKFTAGTLSKLGSVAGVGGPIDIVVVRPRQENLWSHGKPSTHDRGPTRSNYRDVSLPKAIVGSLESHATRAIRSSQWPPLSHRPHLEALRSGSYQDGHSTRESPTRPCLPLRERERPAQPDMGICLQAQQTLLLWQSPAVGSAVVQEWAWLAE